MPRPVPAPPPASTIPAHSFVLAAEPSNYEAPPVASAPRPPFLFMAHASRWQVYEPAPGVFEVLPNLGQLTLQAGVSNVRRTRSGALDARDAIEQRRRAGWTVIPHDVDGPGTSTLREPAPGCFTSRWERLVPGTREADVDVAGFCAWLRSLVDRGIVRPMLAVVGARLLRDAEQAYSVAEDAARTEVPSAVRERDRASARLAAVRAAHAAALARDAGER